MEKRHLMFISLARVPINQELLLLMKLDITWACIMIMTKFMEEQGAAKVQQVITLYTALIRKNSMVTKEGLHKCG